MSKIARRYDVDVEYKGSVTKEVFAGRVLRSENISEARKMIELTRSLHFETRGRVVTVLP